MKTSAPAGRDSTCKAPCPVDACPLGACPPAACAAGAGAGDRLAAVSARGVRGDSGGGDVRLAGVAGAERSATDGVGVFAVSGAAAEACGSAVDSAAPAGVGSEGIATSVDV